MPNKIYQCDILKSRIAITQTHTASAQFAEHSVVAGDHGADRVPRRRTGKCGDRQRCLSLHRILSPHRILRLPGVVFTLHGFFSLLLFVHCFSLISGILLLFTPHCIRQSADRRDCGDWQYATVLAVRSVALTQTVYRFSRFSGIYIHVPAGVTMGGISESDQHSDRTGFADTSGNSQDSEFTRQFLGKIWADLGWGLPAQLNTNSQLNTDSQLNKDSQVSTDVHAALSDSNTGTPPIFLPDIPREQPNRPDDQPPIPPFLPPSDEPDAPHVPPPESTTGGKIIELRKLVHSAAAHNTPDAEVRLPANFDPTKPIHLVIYNHGFGSNVQSAFTDNKLDAQMAGAPDNTVLVVPEWQKKAGANSGDQGNFENKGMFNDMLLEIFSKTPGLEGKTLKDVDNIGIISHSAGYGPCETELNNNGLADKVTSITLIDALYDNHGFDDWIKQNAKEINAGTKRFYNFFFDTSKYSNQLLDRIKDLLPGTPVYSDLKNGDTIMDAATLASHPVVFKYSTAKEGGLGEHWSMPHFYVGPVEEAAKINSKHS